MKLILLLTILMLSGCATPRVLVTDCHEAGPDVLNCEEVKRL